MYFSCKIFNSPVLMLFVIAASFSIIVGSQPVTAIAWQDEAKSGVAIQTDDPDKGSDGADQAKDAAGEKQKSDVATEDKQKSGNATSDAGAQDDSPLIDSPLESTRPVVPKKVLPLWAKEKDRSDLPELKDLAPRDLLVDVDQGELEHLYDYEAIEPDDLTLIKILYRLHRFSWEEIWHFVQQTKSVVPAEIAQDPSANRLKLFRLQGRVTKVERHDLLARVAELYQIVDVEGIPQSFASYYRVHTLLEPNDQLATICVVDVPAAWKTAAEVNEPFACSAMFLKVNSIEENPADLLFAAQHLEWYPESNALDSALSEGELLLAKRGFDVSLLAGARARNRKSIDGLDTPCFYGMLGAVNKMTGDDFHGDAVPELDLLELMNHAAKNHGHVFNLEADIRNVTEVKIDQDYFRQQLGMDHYYQLDGFINTDIEIVDPELKKAGAPSYGKRFPISVCVPSLPAGMQVDSKSIYQVSMPVFFFKIWPYKSQWTRQSGKNLEQTAPLLIGLPPDIESQTASSPFTTVLMGVVCLLLFGFIWIGFWKLTKKSRPTERTKFQIGGSVSQLEQDKNAATGTQLKEPPPTDLPKIDM